MISKVPNRVERQNLKVDACFQEIEQSVQAIRLTATSLKDKRNS